MHSNPARNWTVDDLAKDVGMSRSSFALKFKETVGSTPMEYLTRWRMLLAGDRLLNTGEAILPIAISLGYDSESSFGRAFKRVWAALLSDKRERWKLFGMTAPPRHSTGFLLRDSSTGGAEF
jgi:AraC-like DNA-binding protein